MNLNAQIRMSGTFTYSSQGNVVTFGVQRIDNFNSIFSISGTLAIQLWATTAPYNGVGTLVGNKLAEVNIGQLQGGFFFSNVVRTTTITNLPPGGTYNIVFVLAEFVGFQFLTDDFGNFPTPQPIGTIVTAPSILTSPQNVTLAVGQSDAMTVSISGSLPVAYQWRKNGSAIVGATSATLNFSNVQTADAGSYSVVVTNGAGSVTSTNATLTVNAVTIAPTIATQPTSQSATAGGSVTFSVSANGSAPFNYQWRKNGSAIVGATSATLNFANVQTADAGSYSVVVTNGAGSVTSTNATLTVDAVTIAPTIATQPTSQSATAGGSVTFSVSANGSAPFNYQWRKNGSAIVGATSATLNFANVQTADAGSYSVVVTNGAGSVTSTNATLTVDAVTIVPTIATQPTSQSATVGGSVTLSVSANGSAPFNYQWRKDGAAISGATNGTLTLSSVQSADAGSYTVVVTNSAGSATSTAATLTVNIVATISTPPVSRTVDAGTTTTFTVVATGAAPFSYQWRKDGTAISGATNGTLTLSSVQSTDAGNYTVVITNSAGSTTSSAATLAVTIPNPGRLINLSVLAPLTTAGDTFTLGYVVNGASTTNTKPLVIRSAGPSLGALGVSGTLADPQLELFAGPTKTGGNDDWGGLTATAMAAVGAFAYTGSTSRDAAIAANITSRDNSVKISAGSSAPNGTGTVIAEVYDATPSASFTVTTPRLINFSVIKNVSTSVTLGFVIGGATNETVLVRAVGPTLGTAPFNVGGVMADPKVELFDAAGKSLATNDNWGGTAALATAFGATGAFALPTSSKDAALVVTLAPGNYSVVVTPVSGTATGTALLEVYEVP